MSKQKFYRVVILLVLLSIYPLIVAQTWSTPERISPYVTGSYIIFSQGLTADSSGTPWCGWVAETYNPPAFNIYINHYTDTTWSDPDTIYPFLIFYMYCDLAVDANGNVWVVAEDDGLSACFYDGSSWSNLMAVPTQGGCSHYPVATGDSLGNLWVCWMGSGPGDGHHIWGNAYISGSWGSPVLISYPSTTAEEITYSMTTDIQGNVWVGWYAFYYFDAWICVSFNDGSAWSDTMVIAEYSYSSLGPALTVDTSGKIWAGWLGCDSGSNWRVYASYFEDSVWSGPMLVSESAASGDYSVAITSDDKGMVWLTWMNSDLNIYYSYWNGNNWSTPAPVDTHPADDYDLKMTFDGERIWVTWIREVSYTFSVYASYTYGVGVEEKPVANLPPSVLGLKQNCPNPFSSYTTISYQLPSDCHVCLKIYNVAGELVQTLVSKNQETGHYSVRWDGKDEKGRVVPSGIYFYHLNAGNCTSTKRMILIQ